MITRNDVASRRKYSVKTVAQAREISRHFINKAGLQQAIKFGLPEVDDRYHIWRVPVVMRSVERRIGEIVIDAYTSLIDLSKSTSHDIMEQRLLEKSAADSDALSTAQIRLSSLRNTLAHGDAELVLQDLPAESVNLVFTSPPYFNARPEYTDYITYEEYLLKIRKIIQQTHRVLAEGRFFAINTAPVLLRRASRGEASKRIAVPFDVHRLFIEEGFDFIDDIIWVKPEGAGWATGRGRRFAADRQPLQYKAVPVTEYIMVYRKRTERLIDWNIRNHPDKKAVSDSTVNGDYDVTNVWRIHPSFDKEHPAVFPLSLAQKIITYYSFKGDVVLDPFAGTGTVGKAAIALGRRFVLIEKDQKYFERLRNEAATWLGKEASAVATINSTPLDEDQTLF